MLTVIIENDPDAESPAEHGDQWTLHSFGRRHSNYADPATLGLSYDTDATGRPKVVDRKLRTKLKSGLAFFCWYFEHGQSVWGITDNAGRQVGASAGVEFRWDGVRYAGLLVWDHPAADLGPKTYEDRAQDAAAFLRSFSAWTNGEYLMYAVEDEGGECVDSCCGFDDLDYMLTEIAPTLKGQEFRVKGDAAWVEGKLRSLAEA